MSDNDILNAFMGSVADGIAATEAAVNRLAAQNADLLAACKALVGLVEAMGLDAITATIQWPYCASDCGIFKTG